MVEMLQQRRRTLSGSMRAAGTVPQGYVARIVLCCLTLLCLCSCDSTKSRRADARATASAAAGGKPVDRVTLMLNWYPEAEHGGFYAAQLYGIFAKHNLEVAIRPGGVNAPVAQELVSGRVQFAVGNADDVLLFRQQDADIVALLAPIQQTPRCIMVRADSGIDSLSGLKGRLILQADRGQAFLKFMESRGMLEGVQVVPYSGSVARFVADDKTAIQAYNFSEPQLAEQQGVKAKTLMLSEIGFNPYASCLLATGEQVSSQRELCRRMAEACREGWQKYLDSPEKTNAAILAQNPERMTAEALAYGAEQLKPLCEPSSGNSQTASSQTSSPTDERQHNTSDAWQFGDMQQSRWEQLIEQFTELKLVTPGKVKASEAFINWPTSTTVSQ